MLLAGSMLATIGGRYSWPNLPALVTAAALFLLSGARVAADRDTRALDFVLIAGLALIGLQLVPLPEVVLRTLSPATPDLQDAYALTPFGAWRPLSIHPAATRTGFGLALTGALVFWASREAFEHGGTRAAARVLALIGFACALVALAQHATAPRTLLWKWSVADPRATPFGFFVDRNQLATWLVLAISVVSGYLAMHVHVHALHRTRQDGNAAFVALSDNTSIITLGCLGAMLLTIAATLSRSGFVALIAAAVVGTSLARRDYARGVWVGGAAMAGLIGVAGWLNAEGLAQRIVTTVSAPDPNTVGRLTIWRDTLRIIGEFPFFGTGQGTFADAMHVYQQTARQVLFNHAHDEYLQLLSEGGIVMLTIVVIGIALLARSARQRLADDDGAYRFVRIGACAGLLAVGVQSIWETGLRAPANLLLVAILAAIAVVDRGERSTEGSLA